MERWRDARVGDEDGAEALLGARGVEGRAGEAVPGQSADDPLLDCVRPVGPGAGPGSGGLCAAWAGSARRNVSTRRCARRATRAATAGPKLAASIARPEPLAPRAEDDSDLQPKFRPWRSCCEKCRLGGAADQDLQQQVSGLERQVELLAAGLQEDRSRVERFLNRIRQINQQRQCRAERDYGLSR